MNDIYVFCESKIESDMLRTYLHNKGFEWGCGCCSYLDFDNWVEGKGGIIYAPLEGLYEFLDHFSEKEKESFISVDKFIYDNENGGNYKQTKN